MLTWLGGFNLRHLPPSSFFPLSEVVIVPILSYYLTCRLQTRSSCRHPPSSPCQRWPQFLSYPITWLAGSRLGAAASILLLPLARGGHSSYPILLPDLQAPGLEQLPPSSSFPLPEVATVPPAAIWHFIWKNTWINNIYTGKTLSISEAQKIHWTTNGQKLIIKKCLVDKLSWNHILLRNHETFLKKKD